MVTQLAGGVACPGAGVGIVVERYFTGHTHQMDTPKPGSDAQNVVVANRPANYKRWDNEQCECEHRTAQACVFDLCTRPPQQHSVGHVALIACGARVTVTCLCGTVHSGDG